MPPDEHVLAIDVGSTWCKAAYIDHLGRVAASGEAWVRDMRRFGHDETALARVWQGVTDAVAEAGREFGRPRPAAIAVTAHKAPGIWLDGTGRAVGLPEEVVAEAGHNEIDACYASPLWRDDDPFAYGYGIDLIGNTRWLWRNHPEWWARLRRIGNLHSWLNYRLTGRWATSPSGGPVQQAWPDTVRTLTGLPPELYPVVYRDTEIISRIHPRTASELGFDRETPVITGTHDGAAANIGAGALQPGDACLTLATNGVLRVVTGERIPGRFGYTITGERWVLVRDLPDLAFLLDNVAATLLELDAQVTPEQHDDLTNQAAGVPAGARGLRLQLFDGSRGLTVEQARAAGHDTPVIYRAALEAVALGFAGLVRQARAAGAEPRSFVATGGVSENDLILRITSACLDAPVDRPEREAGLLGVAALAAVGVGWYPDVYRAVDGMRGPLETIAATEAERAAYAEIVDATDLPPGVAPGDGIARAGP